jgi:hypothetical protein
MRTEQNRSTLRRAFAAWQTGTVPCSRGFSVRFANGERLRPNQVRTIVADGDAVVVVWEGAGVVHQQLRTGTASEPRTARIAADASGQRRALRAVLFGRIGRSSSRQGWGIPCMTS